MHSAVHLGAWAGAWAGAWVVARLLLGGVPVAYVLVAVYIGEGPLAVRLIILPVALVSLSVDVLRSILVEGWCMQHSGGGVVHAAW